MLIETLGSARDMGRLNQILGVLIRHGFGDSVANSLFKFRELGLEVAHDCPLLFRSLLLRFQELR